MITRKWGVEEGRENWAKKEEVHRGAKMDDERGPLDKVGPCHGKNEK